MLERKDDSVTMQQDAACQKVFKLLSTSGRVSDGSEYPEHLIAMWDGDGSSYSVKDFDCLREAVSVFLPSAEVDIVDGVVVLLSVDEGTVSLGSFLLTIHQLQEALPQWVRNPVRVSFESKLIYIVDGEFIDAAESSKVTDTKLEGTELVE
jgi:hypothetical protein